MDAVLISEGSRLIFKIAGDMSFEDNKTFREFAEGLLDKEASDYVLDVSSLKQVDSAGLGMMLTLQKWGEDKGKTILLRYDEESLVGKMVNLGRFSSLFKLDS